MKNRFSTYDLVCIVTELQKYIGMRVVQVYDVDNKTYLIKLQKPEEKCVLLLESGNRLHATAFEWPKNNAPSGFSMKMRKHLRNKRLESLRQLGMDRMVDMQFGSGEAAYHVILELYDRGNIILTDCDLVIINILRPHTEGEEIRFAVREKFPVDRAHLREGPPTRERLGEVLAAAKPGDSLKKILNPHLEYGPAIIDHVLLQAGFSAGCKLNNGFDAAKDVDKLTEALVQADKLIDIALQEPSKGYIVQKREMRQLPDGTEEEFFTNQEFHPMIFEQHSKQPIKEFPTFDAAVDEFFSMVESQKIDMKSLQQEREAMKKLANVRRDHEQRLVALERTQDTDKQRAELISRNQALVDSAILAVRGAVANQMTWPDIDSLVKEAQARGDPVAGAVKKLHLERNHMALTLSDPFVDDESSDEANEREKLKPMVIEIDLALTAYANARKYYDQKRYAAKKQQKTLDATGKALKSAEKKTKQTLKDVQIIRNINKARKVYWFEKFYWFISSENFLVIGGRDQIQNEMIVKRYMRAADVYVHADIQGGSSVVVKNPSGQPVPPKTLNEAGGMAVCYSVAWDAKVVTSAWWVQSDQVSKTAPAGEYLSTGSFMVRGKKNYLPPCHLIMGFSFLFKLEDSSVERHKDERKVREIEDVLSSELTLVEYEQEVELIDSEDNQSDGEDKLPTVSEEACEGEREGETCEGEGEGEADKGREGEESESESESVSEKEEEETKVEFPDTEIKIEHTKGSQVTIHTNAPLMGRASEPAAAEHQFFLGDDKPVTLKPRVGRQHRPSETKGRDKPPPPQPPEQEDKPKQQAKRGQKAKLKKIKEKYKYQDEEERSLRMEILQSAGAVKEGKKSKKGGKEVKGKGGEKKVAVPRVARPAAVPKAEGEGEESDGEEPVVAEDVDMLDSLTGVPVAEDELLFAVPVVAPYNTLQNYKFKVKLTPGTGKRGKATKMAINMFLKDRYTTQREKDLIRSVKDETLARNLPGKVKVSAPQLQKSRK